MFKVSNFDEAISNLKKKEYLCEFFEKTFDYKIDKIENFDYHLQKIEGDSILYIYEKKNKNVVYAYEFVDDDNELYMEKSVYHGVSISVVHMKKCISLYKENNVVDNIIFFVMALSSDNPKRYLLEYLDVYLVEQLLNNI